MTRACLVLIALAGLACTGAATDDSGGKDGDPFDRGDDTGSGGTGDDESFEQTKTCEDYLDCVAAVDPDAYDDAQDRYGQSGSCWNDDADEAEACDEACDDLLSALADDYPDEEACGGKPDDTGNPDDTGDTGNPDDTGDSGGDTGDTGSSSSGCALDDGAWVFDLAYTSDACGLADFGASITGTTDCTSSSTGRFTLEADLGGLFPVAFDCTSSSRDFACEGADGMGFGLEVSMTGRANSGGDAASGDFSVDIPSYSCSSAGTFSGSM